MDVAGVALAVALASGGFACTFNHGDLGHQVRGSGGSTGGGLESADANPPIDLGSTDGAAVADDLGGGDVATSGFDQANAAVDQAPFVDQGKVKLDAGADMDVHTSDTLALPDLSVQPDLTGTPDGLVRADVTSSPDLLVMSDLLSIQDLSPSRDLPSTQDMWPTADSFPAPDAANQTDTLTLLDTSTVIDTSGAVETGDDATAPMVWPDKLTYSAGEKLTAHFTNGSTDTTAWIGIFPVGASDTAYRDWDYTGGIPVGTVILYVPGTAGTYELRMFNDSTFSRAATSVPFVVQ